MDALEQALGLGVAGLEDDPADGALAAEGGELLARAPPPAWIAPYRQDAALPMLVRRLGATRLYALHDGQGPGFAHVMTVSRLASRLGIRPVDASAWDPDARDYSDLARPVGRAQPEMLLVAGCFCENGARLVSDVRRERGPRVPIVTPDAFLDARLLLGRAGAATENLRFTIAGLPEERVPPTGRAASGASTRLPRTADGRLLDGGGRGGGGAARGHRPLRRHAPTHDERASRPSSA